MLGLGDGAGGGEGEGIGGGGGWEFSSGMDGSKNDNEVSGCDQGSGGTPFYGIEPLTRLTLYLTEQIASMQLVWRSESSQNAAKEQGGHPRG